MSSADEFARSAEAAIRTVEPLVGPRGGTYTFDRHGHVSGRPVLFLRSHRASSSEVPLELDALEALVDAERARPGVLRSARSQRVITRLLRAANIALPPSLAAWDSAYVLAAMAIATMQAPTSVSLPDGRPATWILQANPERYHIDAALRLLDGGLTWSLNQYARQVQPGDTVFIWRAAAGKRVAGIIARAAVASIVPPGASVDDAQFWRGEPASGSSVPGARLDRIEVLPVGGEMTRASLKDDDRTASLHILRAPAQTVYAADPDTAQVLHDRFDAALHGVRIPEQPDPAFELPASARTAVVSRWRDALLSPAWWRHVESAWSARSAFAAEFREQLASFVDGTADLDTFRAWFDLRTRSNADGFSFGGISGAMILNQIAKRMDAAEATELLVRVLPAPADEAGARAQFDLLYESMSRVQRTGSLPLLHLNPNRAATLLSYLWHLQRPIMWPAYYPRLRAQFAEWGALHVDDPHSIDGYLAFAAVFDATCRELGEHPWTVSTVVGWYGQDDDDSAAPDTEIEAQPRVWLIAPGRGAEHWEMWRQRQVASIGWSEMGDLTAFDDRDALRDALIETYRPEREPRNNVLTIWDFVHTMAPGDVLWVKTGRGRLIGRGVVAGEAEYVPDAGEQPTRRSVRWDPPFDIADKRLSLPLKTLTEITRDDESLALFASLAPAGVDADADFVDDTDVDDASEAPFEPYGLTDAMRDLFVEEGDVAQMLELLRARKNLVLQGPPGTGKTFVARRLAWALMGEKASDRITIVQFHQSVSYEDFVEGYRPDGEGGFQVAPGPFRRICRQAMLDGDNDYVLLVDEINRGNLSRIFGELLMLLEADKREEAWAVSLTYARAGDPPFWVPPNLHVIGTMNTADRSLALVDYALRRRFAFVTVPPAYGSASFRDYLSQRVGGTLADHWLEAMSDLNERIASDPGLGRGFCIGHSYFCAMPPGQEPDVWLRAVVEFEVAPLLREYWFDDEATADNAVDALLEVLA